jgi:ABC-2 type transport system ATP-binding protein
LSIIHVRNLVKEFRLPKRQAGLLGSVRTLFTREVTVTRAVDGVSFDVEEGERVGYLGPNGAGKSTTIKVLTGILVPTSGEVAVAGLAPWRDRERNALNIGVVFGQRSQLWWDLPLSESFKLVAKLYRMSPAAYRRNLDRFVTLLDMGEFLEQPVRTLSLGQRMRGDLAAAMLYEPRLLYLDEPTVGLDVLAKERIRLFIEEINADHQTTVLLTTHDLGDVERLCPRLLMIDHGRVLFDGTVEHLKARYGSHRTLVVQMAAEGVAIDLPDVEEVRREDARIWLRFQPEQISAPRLIADLAARYPVTDLSLAQADLEGIIRQIYQERQVRDVVALA